MNAFPALAPRRATLFTSSEPHCGQTSADLLLLDWVTSEFAEPIDLHLKLTQELH